MYKCGPLVLGEMEYRAAKRSRAVLGWCGAPFRAVLIWQTEFRSLWRAKEGRERGACCLAPQRSEG